MTIAKEHVFVDLKVNLELRESEARALNEVLGFGDEKVVQVLTERLAPLKHIDGLRTLLNHLRRELPPILHRTDEARKVLTEHLTPKQAGTDGYKADLSMLPR